MIIFVHFYFPFSVHCYIIIYNPEFYKQLEVNTTGYSKEMNIKTNIDNMPNKQGFQCIFLNDQNELFNI
mgnify:CR=1 FL=1